ncbi:MAG: Gfo/Idh/MocA family oxidoreductase [Bacteroidia bacterium]
MSTESTMSQPVRIALLGAGHLGKIHLKCLQELPDVFEVVGVYDPDPVALAKAVEVFGVQGFEQPELLMDQVDAVDIVAPTLSHYDLAMMALRRLKHLFIEKPLAGNPSQALEMLNMAREAGVKAQVGHVERFNPVFTQAASLGLAPRFIEAHRLASYNPRGTDVSIVLDLMIHDIDLVLAMVRSEVKEVKASGVSVVSSTPDIANARLEFHNGTVANLTASRISLKTMRKMRIFQNNAYWSLDFLDKKLERIEMQDQPGEGNSWIEIGLGPDNPPRYLSVDRREPPSGNAIRDELQAFGHSIQQNTKEAVSIDEGYNALRVAHMILEKIANA